MKITDLLPGMFVYYDGEDENFTKGKWYKVIVDNCYIGVKSNGVFHALECDDRGEVMNFTRLKDPMGEETEMAAYASYHAHATMMFVKTRYSTPEECFYYYCLSVMRHLGVMAVEMDRIFSTRGKADHPKNFDFLAYFIKELMINYETSPRGVVLRKALDLYEKERGIHPSGSSIREFLDKVELFEVDSPSNKVN